MRVHLTSLGCRLNEAELETWSRQFQQRGHQLSTHHQHADLVVVNTCAVTDEAVRKSRKLLRRVQRDNPAARLVVSGCYASLNPQESADLPGVDLLIDNRDKAELVQRVSRELDLPLMPVSATDPDANGLFQRGRQRAFIKVQDGCRYRCAFCERVFLVSELEIALWFHDAVYEPRRSDNEQRSADWARRELRRAGATVAQQDRIGALVTVTAHDGEPQTDDEALMSDIDLAILGSGPARFEEYEQQVRSEYQHLPLQLYRAGRRKLLGDFLARPRIYLTADFFEQREEAARRNLQRSVERLSAKFW